MNALPCRVVVVVVASALFVAGCSFKTDADSAPEPPAEQAEAGNPHQPANRASQSKQGQWYAKNVELYYGFRVSVQFVPRDEALAARVWAYLESIDDIFNDYRDDSEVARINALTDRVGLDVSREMADAITLAQQMHESTDGAFDITLGPLRRLWKGASRTGEVPGEAAIKTARQACGMEQVKLKDRKLTIDSPNLKLDFGGIIKGMAVDRVIAMLKAEGVRSALVQVGGETGSYGLNRRDQPFVLGIEDPQHPFSIETGLVHAPVAGLSAASSSNAHLPIEIGGTAYYHIFDPSTGHPISVRVLGTNIVFPQIGRNGMADALSTAIAILAPERALSIVEAEGGEARIMVMEGESVREYKTAGWDNLISSE